MTDSSNTSSPSSEQLLTARAAHWHQDATPLLTIESLRTWLNAAGLVLYLPKPLQIPTPAPSFVEATLGSVNPSPTVAEMDTARRLLARLVAEGAAVPLNLLGVTGGNGTDVPDFVASAAVFSYIFTLRGNKAWKLPPVTTGPVKVSPLALATYEALAEHGQLSAFELTTHVGKEATEVAILRALTELWTQLRVLPVFAAEGTSTAWELSTARFTKQIKSGANAGQPSALSALISLYLGQSLLATEDEIETFLSPLAARSRLREVIHALLQARQLDSLAIEGKTLLYVAGDLPAFAAEVKLEAATTFETTSSDEAEADPDAPRISKFVPKPGSKIGTGLRVRPAAKSTFARKPAFGAAPERRPFDRAARPAADSASRPAPRKPSFDKPWIEDQKDRPARPERPARSSSLGGDRPTPRTGERSGYAGKPKFPRAAASGDERPARREWKPRTEGDAPARREWKPRAEGTTPARREWKPKPDSDAPARREWKPRTEGDASAPRKTFSKPGTFTRKREGFGRSDSDARPARREFKPRGEGEAAPPRRPGSFTPRPSRPASDRPERPSAGGFGAKRPFTPRTGFSRPSFGGTSRPPRAEAGDGEAPRKVFRKFDAPRTTRTFKSDGPKSEGSKSGFGAKPKFAGKPAAKRPFAKAGSPFAKFADGAKPFRKPGPGKKSTGPKRKPGRGE